VDKLTWEAWQSCEHAELGPRLRELVTIDPAGSGGDTFARIALTGADCPFLTGGLCEIHATLGEEHLSTVCASYPRVASIVDGVLQRSLALSCPEAARLMLLDPAPMEFDEEEGPQIQRRALRIARLTTAEDNGPKPYGYFHGIRAFVIWLLQYRACSVWKRLVILASFCDRLHALAPAHSQTPRLIEEYRAIVAGNLFDSVLANLPPRPALQLELVLELIVQRIGSDIAPARFLESYREFMQGIEWTSQSSMDDIGARYANAFSSDYAPFMAGHEYMLEHLLVACVHRTLFPLGPQEQARESAENPPPESIRDQCLMLLVHYAIIQTVLIGVAAFHKEAFAAEHVVKVVQSSTKAFDHSQSFPAAALRLLAKKGVNNCAALALLLRMQV